MFGIGKKKDKAAVPVEPSMGADVSIAQAAAPAVAMQPAGFWLRVVALVVDYGVLLVVLAALLMVADSVGGQELQDPLYWLWVVATFFYWPVLESSAWRATVGKKLLGVVVGDIDGGGLNFLRSLLRNLAKIISSIPLGIGFLLAAFTARKQALHDLITKAVVMRKGGGSVVKALGALLLGIALIVAGAYLTADYKDPMTRELEAMMSGGVAEPPAKPAPQAAVKPPVAPKPPAPAPSAPPPAAAKPAPTAAPVPAAPAPQAPTQAPAAKPAPAPVQMAQAPATAKPAPTPPAAATTSAAAKPAPSPAPAAKPAVPAAPKPAAAAAVAKPAPAPKPEPAMKPEPVKAAAAPKPEPVEAKPAPAAEPPAAPRVPAEPLVPLARVSIPAQPGPRFNDVMTAVLYRDRETVRQLVGLGRWLDKRDSNGLTPLMVAASIGDGEMVRLLLQNGANPGLQAPGGMTALDFALEAGDAATTQLLQRKR
jgi:uncharacterized RDD family membrane protein YckC